MANVSYNFYNGTYRSGWVELGVEQIFIRPFSSRVQATITSSPGFKHIYDVV